MSSTPHTNIQERLEKIKCHAINKLVSGMFFLALFAVPFSVSRAWFTGWQHAYTVHLIGLCVFTFVFFLRNKLPNNVKIWLIFAIALAVAVAGLLNYGVVGNGTLWAMFCLMLCVCCFDNRIVAITTTILFSAFVLSMYQFVIVGKAIAGGADVYAASFAGWGTMFVGSAMFLVLIGAIVANQQQQAIEMLAELEDKNLLVESQKQQIEHQANHDTLTGLPTLRLANDRLEMAINLALRENHKLALLFLDLDGFKAVNDSYGHDAGDIILRETANRILSTIRESDTACRIGGDEFIVILSKVDKTIDVAQLCSRLIETIGTSIAVGGTKLVVGVSIGVAICPSNAQDVSSLKIKADQAMYEVKKTGKNNYLIAQE